MDAFENQYDSAKEKARELLHAVLPDEQWSTLEKTGVIEFIGKRGIYLISPYAQTKISDCRTRRRTGHACLQLTIPAPAYDRVLAEYLLLRNAEDLYWKTANIFGEDCTRQTEIVLAVLDLALLLNILRQFL